MNKNAPTEQAYELPTTSANRQPQDWAKLIRKLRWMRLEDEACRLQSAVCRLPPEERGTVSAGPFSTD